MTESAKTRIYKMNRQKRIEDDLRRKELDRIEQEETLKAKLSAEEELLAYDNWQRWRKRILEDARYWQLLSYFDEQVVHKMMLIIDYRYEMECTEPSEAESGLRLFLNILEARMAYNEVRERIPLKN